jgi:MFS family permease
MLPLQTALGWNVGVISSSAAIGIFLYGLVGPFAAAVMLRFGIRRTVLGALMLMSASTGASYFMTAPWQLFLTWGLLSGIGSGAVANVLGATIVNRWFTTNRGLVMGLLTASTATGTFIFTPGLAALVEWGGWKPVVLTVAACCAALIPLVYVLVPERPASPLVFGWVVAGHQLGAACAALFAGFVRSAQGDYLQAFTIASATGIVAAVLLLTIGRRPAQPVLAAA